MKITLLSPVLGAELSGIDLARPLSDGEFAAVVDAFHRYKLLRFPAQRLDPAHQVAFSRRFGPLEIHTLDQYHAPGAPEIYVLSNVGPDGRTTGVHPDKGTLVWHSDGSFLKTPPLATILYAIEAPRRGGDTLFADMERAFAALPAAMQARLEEMRAVHDLDSSRRRAGEAPMTPEQRARTPPIEQPLVRTHPASGRKSLYVSHHVDRIVGDPDGSLLAELRAHAARDEFVFANRWAAGDLVVWDNRCLNHKATPYDTADERRIIHRTVVRG